MRCDAKAMCNLGQMKMRGNDIRTDMAGGIVVPERCRPWNLQCHVYDCTIWFVTFFPARGGGQQLVGEDWEPPIADHVDMCAT
jgi:hypothetical protein